MTEEMKEILDTIQESYRQGYKDATDKACKWLKENKNHPLIGCEDPCLEGYLTDEFIEQFKKATE